MNWQCGYLLASQKFVHGLASLLLSCLFYCSEKLLFSTLYLIKKMCQISPIFAAKFNFFSVGQAPDWHIGRGKPHPFDHPILLHPWTFLFPQSLGSRWNIATWQTGTYHVYTVKPMQRQPFTTHSTLTSLPQNITLVISTQTPRTCSGWSFLTKPTISQISAADNVKLVVRKEKQTLTKTNE